MTIPNLHEPLRKDALKKANYAAEIVKSKYPGIELFLFGSVIWNNVFTDHSDIDIAVKGLKCSREYLKIYGYICDAVSPFDVDVVLLEEVSENLRQRITEEGLKL